MEPSDVTESLSHLVIAIDFGTARTGYGFAFASTKDKISVNPPWPLCPGAYVKTLTNLLLSKKDLSIKGFGFEARNTLATSGTPDDYLLFVRYKMALHSAAGSDRTPKVKAVNSDTEVDLFYLIMITLKFLKESALVEINKGTTVPVSANKIRWVLTVPAIWDNAAKQIMLDAADRAGMTNELKDNISIALEPEAASIYCCHQLGLNLEEGTKYVIVDAGGGTVDITCHEVLGKGEGLREISAPSGGDWGSTYVDDNFVKFLKGLFGGNVNFSRVMASSEWIDLMNSFEAIKLNCKPDALPTSKVNIPIGLLLSEWIGDTSPDEVVKQWNKEHKFQVNITRSQMLQLPIPLVIELFESLISKLTTHMDNLLKEDNLQGVKYIFLVGGFAESAVLQTALIDQYQIKKGIEVKVPTRPSFAIISGAVQYGFQPNSIVSRVASRTYGIEMTEPWNNAKHTGAKKTSFAGREYCDNVFDTFIRQGEWVALQTEVKRTYIPVDPTQTTVDFAIYSCQKPNVFFTTDPGVEFIGCLSLDIPDRGKPGKDRAVETKMLFGGTHFTVEAKYLATGRRVNARFKFALNSTEALKLKKPSRQPPTIDLCFCMDVTGSMQSWISEAKAKVMDIAQSIASSFTGTSLRMAFIGYRDIKDHRRFEIVEFTPNVDSLKTGISHVIADGGGDTPEDIFGALQQVLSLKWDSTSRVLIHIADAPCHGNKYHKYPDDYPHGDPNGLSADLLLENLVEKNIDYYFIKINSTTDTMIAEFQRLYNTPQKTLVVHNLASDTSALLPTVLQCVTTSVTAYNP